MGKFKHYVPNMLTLFRILLIPFFAYFAIKNYYLVALLIFVGAALTDTFDGIIARKFQFVSSFGKIFDPLADKLLVVVALIIITKWGLIYWWLTGLIIIRQIFISLYRNYLIKHKIYLEANIFGKIKTTTQMVTIIITLCYKTFFIEQILAIETIILILFFIATAITWISAIIYWVDSQRKLGNV